VAASYKAEVVSRGLHPQARGERVTARGSGATCGKSGGVEGPARTRNGKATIKGGTRLVNNRNAGTHAQEGSTNHKMGAWGRAQAVVDDHRSAKAAHCGVPLSSHRRACRRVAVPPAREVDAREAVLRRVCRHGWRRVGVVFISSSRRAVSV
jgi:hypothetical protein